MTHAKPPGSPAHRCVRSGPIAALLRAAVDRVRVHPAAHAHIAGCLDRGQDGACHETLPRCIRWPEHLAHGREALELDLLCRKRSAVGSLTDEVQQHGFTLASRRAGSRTRHVWHWEWDFEPTGASCRLFGRAPPPKTMLSVLTTLLDAHHAAEKRHHSNSIGYVVKPTIGGSYDWLYVLDRTKVKYSIKACLAGRRSVTLRDTDELGAVAESG